MLTEHVRGDWTYAYLDNGLGEDMDDRTWASGPARLTLAEPVLAQASGSSVKLIELMQ